MSRVEEVRNVRAGSGQAEPGLVGEIPEQVFSAQERNGQSRTRGIDKIKSQGKGVPDQDSSKQDGGEVRSRPRADQKHDRKEERKSKRGRDKRSEAREGHDRIMPKKDME